MWNFGILTKAVEQRRGGGKVCALPQGPAVPDVGLKHS